MWSASIVATENWTAISGLFWGMMIGSMYGRRAGLRERLDGLTSTEVSLRYRDKDGMWQTISRKTPSGFGRWSVPEKMRWMHRAEVDLAKTASNDMKQENQNGNS